MEKRAIDGTMDEEGEMLKLAQGIARLSGGKDTFRAVVTGASVDVLYQGLDDAGQARYRITLFVPGIGFMTLTTRNQYHQAQFASAHSSQQR